jgi:hypothetical protein
LVERHLAKVEVAGSNPVFRSASNPLSIRWSVFEELPKLLCSERSRTAEVVELVDTLDLKSSGQKCPYGFKSRLQYEEPSSSIDLEGFLFLELYGIGSLQHSFYFI